MNRVKGFSNQGANKNNRILDNQKNQQKKDEDGSSESSDEEGDDEEACELTENVEKTFFKTLSCLKKKDPKIYHSEARFFEKDPEIDEDTLKRKLKEKKSQEQSLLFGDYRKTLQGHLELSNADTEKEEDAFSRKKTYVQEQDELKESFKSLVKDLDDESEIDDLLQERPGPSKQVQEQEDADYRAWLKGQSNELKDKSEEEDMKYLHDYWNDPKLNEDEKFLRDYILNKRFLEKGEKDDERFNADRFVSLEEDEKILESQTEFEHKYNFRFEEPDQEFIKRYPRIMEGTLRKKDNRRKLQREAIKNRKLKEKEEKRQKLKKLQTLKLKEIEDKLAALKEITGNDQLGFEDADIEKDFDPNEYDAKMQKLFSEEYYNQEENKKPIFEGDLNLDQYKDEDDYEGTEYDEGTAEPYCEDDDFNMDCDYTPEKAALAKKMKLEARIKKKNKKGIDNVNNPETVLSETINRPIYDKTIHSSFQNYLDEYYKLDCEDFIGDMPCRFKYREVEPNSFGLTIEEILAADDKELDKWCNLQKIKGYRSREVEKFDVKAYQRKAMNEDLKMKILPSLYRDPNDDNEASGETKKKKKKKKKKRNSLVNQNDIETSISDTNTEQNKKFENKDQDDTFEESVNGAKQHFNKKKGSAKVEQSYNHLDNTLTKSETNGNKDDNEANSESKKNKKNKKKSNGVIHQNGAETLVSDVNNDQNKKLKNESQDFVTSKENINGKLHFNKKNVKVAQSKNNDNLGSTHTKNEKNNNKNNNVSDNKLKRKRKHDNQLGNKQNWKRLKQNSNEWNIKKKKSNDNSNTIFNSISDSRLEAYGIKPKKFKNKLKYGNVN